MKFSISSITALALVAVSTFCVNGYKINPKTINNIIREEKSFILFNSRRLTGECCKY
jgi:hypothetical protein